MENSETEKQPESDPKVHPLLNVGGWKRDLKKIIFVLAAFGVMLFFWMVAAGISFGLPFGIRADLFIERVKYEKYSHMGPDFSFLYPGHYVLDENQEGRFGKDYLSGIRLATDQRTGCDVRFAQAGINFQKKDDEIKDALVRELSKSAKDFKLISFGRRKIGGEESFRIKFSFVDPTGGTVRLSQDIVSHEGQAYLMICGTGDYQYKFFEKDFQNFIDSFKWEAAK